MASQRKLVSFGNYRLNQVSLGKGSFGRVELATHLLIGTKVAMKMVYVNEIKDLYVRTNLHREATILSNLKHPNIVKLIEICSTADIYCLILEYIPGSLNLNEVILKSGPIPEDIAKGLSKQILSALNYMHSKGIIHRDIKLENILVTKDLSHSLIIDFGLSNFWFPGKTMSTHCGSAEYAAPELFTRDKNYTSSVDLWSFGIMLYAMTMQKFPFVLDNKLKALIWKILEGLGPDHLDEMKSKLSDDLSSLIIKCLDLNFKTRITAAEALVHPWLGKLSDFPVVQPSITAGPELFLDAALDIRERLGLQLKPEEILSHVARRPYNTTGGCFNLMMIQKIKDNPEIAAKPVEPCVAPPRLKRIENLPQRTSTMPREKSERQSNDLIQATAVLPKLTKESRRGQDQAKCHFLR